MVIIVRVRLNQLCVLAFALLLAAVRKHAMALGQHSDHLDHRASLLEPVVCACAQKKDSVQHGLHSRCRHDQRSVQYSLAFSACSCYTLILIQEVETRALRERTLPVQT